MKIQETSIRYTVMFAIIFLAAIVRLMPHPHNFTPIGAMALFGAACFGRTPLSVLAPLATLWISDLILNNLILKPQFPQYYPEGFIWITSAWIYVAFLMITALGWLLLSKISIGRLLGASLSASLIFFLVTNFSVWLGSSVYPQNTAGLLTCYIAGIPFFWNTLAGDLTYTAIMFGVYFLVARRVQVQV